MSRFALFAALLLAGFSVGKAVASDFEVTQKNMAFNPSQLNVKVGDSVTFKNEDTTSHNIFSLSDAKSFDLGAFANGQSKKVTFDKPGTVDVECAMHDTMHMKINVTK
jgi:plastocyanin